MLITMFIGDIRDSERLSLRRFDVIIRDSFKTSNTAGIIQQNVLRQTLVVLKM